MGPSELGVAHALAGVRHALEAEIGGVGEHGGEHPFGLSWTLPLRRSRKAERKTVRAATSRKSSVTRTRGSSASSLRSSTSAPGGVSGGKGVTFNLPRTSDTPVQLAPAQQPREALQSPVEHAGAFCQIGAHIGADCQSGGGLVRFALGQQVGVETPVVAGALDPDIAGAQAVAQGREYRGLVEPAVDPSEMEWQVVTVPTTSEPILTSDVPLIINGTLKDDDGCLILPLSTNEFFVAYNLGKIDMKEKISELVATGRFVRSMNKYVVEHRIDYVYGVDSSMMAFVARYWGTSEAPYFPSLTIMPPVRA